MKAYRYKRTVLTLILLLMGCSSVKAQITPSVYLGMGGFTNLGGGIGVGTEVQYKSISANAAIGAAYFRGSHEKEYVGDNPYFGYDFGLKCYVYKGLFCGVNYGVLLKDHIAESPNVTRVENRKGFTFSLGYKMPFLNSFYGLAYIGLTSDEYANRFFNSVMPRIGFILGRNIDLIKD